MSFENMLENAEPRDAAEAAVEMAKSILNDGDDEPPHVKAIAARILELGVDELERRIREKEGARK